MEKQLNNGTSLMDHLLFNKLDELLSQTQLYLEVSYCEELERTDGTCSSIDWGKVKVLSN